MDTATQHVVIAAEDASAATAVVAAEVAAAAPAGNGNITRDMEQQPLSQSNDGCDIKCKFHHLSYLFLRNDGRRHQQQRKRRRQRPTELCSQSFDEIESHGGRHDISAAAASTTAAASDMVPYGDSKNNNVVIDAVQNLREGDWRRNWRGIHLPPSPSPSVPCLYLDDEVVGVGVEVRSYNSSAFSNDLFLSKPVLFLVEQPSFKGNEEGEAYWDSIAEVQEDAVIEGEGGEAIVKESIVAKAELSSGGDDEVGSVEPTNVGRGKDEIAEEEGSLFEEPSMITSVEQNIDGDEEDDKSELIEAQEEKDDVPDILPKLSLLPVERNDADETWIMFPNDEPDGTVEVEAEDVDLLPSKQNIDDPSILSMDHDETLEPALEVVAAGDRDTEDVPVDQNFDLGEQEMGYYDPNGLPQESIVKEVSKVPAEDSCDETTKVLLDGNGDPKAPPVLLLMDRDYAVDKPIVLPMEHDETTELVAEGDHDPKALTDLLLSMGQSSDDELSTLPPIEQDGTPASMHSEQNKVEEQPADSSQEALLNLSVEQNIDGMSSVIYIMEHGTPKDHVTDDVVDSNDDPNSASEEMELIDQNAASTAAMVLDHFEREAMTSTLPKTSISDDTVHKQAHGNRESNDGNLSPTVSKIGAAGKRPQAYSYGPSIPLYPLLLTIAIHYLIKHLLKQMFKKKNQDHDASSNQFVVSEKKLEEHIRLLRFNLQKSKTAISSLQHLHEEAVAKSIFLERIIATFQAKNEGLSADLDSMKAQKIILESQLEDANAKYDDIWSEHRALLADRDQTKNDARVLWNSLEKERLKFKQQKTRFETQMRSFENRLQEGKQQALERSYDQSVIIARLESFRDAARIDLGEKDKALFELRNDLAKMKEGDLLAAKTFEDERSNFGGPQQEQEDRNLKKRIEVDQNHTLTELEDESFALSHLKSEKDQLVSSNRRANADLVDTKRENEIAVQKPNQEGSALGLQGRNDLTLVDVDESKSSVYNLESRLKGLTAKCKAIESELMDCKDDLVRVTDEKAAVSSELHDANAKFEDAVKNHKAGIKQITDEYNALKENIDSVNAKIVQLEMHSYAMTQERDGLASEVKDTKLDLSEAVAKSNGLEENVLKLKDRNKTLSADLVRLEGVSVRYETIQSELIRCVDELQRTTCEKKLVSSELRDVNAKYEDALKNHEANIKQKTDESNALKKAVDSFEEQVSMLTKERDGFSGDLSAERRKNSSLVAMNDQLKLRMGEDTAKFTKDIARLEGLVKEQTSEIASLNKVIKSSYAQITRLHETKVDLAKEKEDLETKNDEAVDKLNDLEKTVNSLQSEIVVSESKKCDLMSQLEEDTSNFQGTITSLNKMIQQKAEEAGALNDSITTLNATVQNYKEQVTALVREKAEAVYKTNEEANLAAKAFEKERLNLIHQEATLRKQVCTLEDCLETEKQKSLDRSKDHAAIVTELENRIASAQSERDEIHLKYNDQLAELDKELLALADLKVDATKAKEDANAASSALEQEQKRFLQQEAALLKQIRHLEQCLDEENHNVLESVKYHSTIAELEKRISIVESDRDKARLQCKQVSSDLSSVGTDLAKAREDVNMLSKALEKERLNFIQRDSSRSNQAVRLKERFEASTKEQARTIAKLEARIASLKCDRDNALKECGKKRQVLSALTAKAKEDATVSSKAEQLNFSQCDAYLKEQLMEMAVTKTNKDHVADIAKLEHRIAVVESERDAARQQCEVAESERDAFRAQCEEKRLSLFTLMSDLAKDEACAAPEDPEIKRPSSNERDIAQDVTQGTRFQQTW